MWGQMGPHGASWLIHINTDGTVHAGLSLNTALSACPPFGEGYSELGLTPPRSKRKCQECQEAIRTGEAAF